MSMLDNPIEIIATAVVKASQVDNIVAHTTNKVRNKCKR